MATLRKLRGSKHKAQENNDAPPSRRRGSTASSDEDSPAKSDEQSNAGIDDNDDEESSTSPDTDDAGADLLPNKQKPPSKSTSISRSPYQVISDLIDATCHEILLLEGDDSESIAPSTSYVTLAQRLDYYMEQVDRAGGEESDDENDGSILKDKIVRCRLVMAKLSMDVCATQAYPNVADDAQQQQTGNVPPLIHSSESQWEEIHSNLQTLKDMAEVEGVEVDDDIVNSLCCQMEAMQALSKLRNQLQSVITEINEGNGTKTASHYNYVKEHLEEYTKSTNFIDEKLSNIHSTRSYSDLFVPHQMLTLKRCTTLERVKDCVTSLLGGIDDMITKKVFPLESFQCQFLKLMKNWEQSCLPLPALFKVGYFQDAKCASAKGSAAAATANPVSPKRGQGRSRTTTIGDDGSDPDFKPRWEPPGKDGGSKRSRNSSPRKTKDKQPKYNDDESDDFMSDSSSPKKKQRKNPPQGRGRGVKGAKSSPRKEYLDDDSFGFLSDAPPSPKSPPTKKEKRMRRGRVPYTEEEKRCLLEGYELFQASHNKWTEILDYYGNVFKVNKRTNVNLKDLYRTLTKKNEPAQKDE